jgi:hypothetical protein
VHRLLKGATANANDTKRNDYSFEKRIGTANFEAGRT